jgi:hypothetical protein
MLNVGDLVEVLPPIAARSWSARCYLTHEMFAMKAGETAMYLGQLPRDADHRSETFHLFYAVTEKGQGYVTTWSEGNMLHHMRRLRET